MVRFDRPTNKKDKKQEPEPEESQEQPPEPHQFMVMVTKQGVIKKTPLKDFENVRRSGLIAIKLKGKDTLEWVGATTGSDTILLTSKNGQSIRFSENDVRSMGRGASGVRGINLKDNDEVVSMAIVNKSKEKNNVLFVMQNGYGKRTEVLKFKEQRRGGTGVKSAAVSTKTGKVVCALLIEDQEELIAISTKGKVIRTVLKSVSKLGRATQGVRIMKMQSGDKVASALIV